VYAADERAQELHGSAHFVGYQVCALMHIAGHLTAEFPDDRLSDLIDNA